MLGFPRRRLRSFAGDERGSFVVMVAGFSACALILVALATDVGRVYLEKRRVQGAVDLAATMAAGDLTNATNAARATLKSNGITDPQQFTVTLGSYQANSAVKPGDRFQAGGAPSNAVKVSLSLRTPIYFGRMALGTNFVTLRAEATGLNTKAAALSIGSRLASLNGGVVNALLSATVGGSVSLSVMDYTALAGAKVDGLSFLNALATRVGLSAGTYDQLLGAQVKLGDILRAVADVAQGDSTVKATLGSLAAVVDATRLVDLRQMISLGPFAKLNIGDSRSVIGVNLSALDLLNAGAQIANGSRQIALDLGLQVPGLAGLTAVINIGERPQTSPWLSVGDAGIVVRTAQTRVRLAAQVGGTGSLLGRLIYLPVAIDLGAAQARLTNLSCGSNPATDAVATVAAIPSVAEIWIGEPQDLTAWASGAANPRIDPAVAVNLLNLTKVTVFAHVAATNASEQTMTFSYADARSLTTKSVKTTAATQTALSSLTSSLQIKLSLLGLDITATSPALMQLLGGLLTPVGALLDPVLNALLDTLGVSIGEADVQLRGIRCSVGALVG